MTDNKHEYQFNDYTPFDTLKKSTRKVVYLVSNGNGGCAGPSNGRFFSEFKKSMEGQEWIKIKKSKRDSNNDICASLILTWLMSQQSATIVSTTLHAVHYIMWTVSVDEEIVDQK